MHTNNPLLVCTETMAACGWHVNSVSVAKHDGLWRGEITVADNVPDGWTWADLGGVDGSIAAIASPPPGPLEGVKGVTVQLWINRPGPYVLPLPPESREVYEQWIAEVARVGKAPDWAVIGEHRVLTKPIEWLPEPIRSALLRKSQSQEQP